jgi:membrane-associated phospholipid phosphatase
MRLTAALSALLFVLLAAAVVTGSATLRTLDHATVAWFHDHTQAAMTQVMGAITLLGGPLIVLSGTAVIALGLLLARAWRTCALFVAVVPGGMLLNVAVKEVIQRHRPVFVDPLLTLTTYSFPSGHTVAAMLLYGALAAYWLRHGGRVSRRAALLAGPLVVALVGLSRLYLGVHYLSDVIAGLLEGLAWLLAWGTLAVESERVDAA